MSHSAYNLRESSRSCRELHQQPVELRKLPRHQKTMKNRSFKILDYLEHRVLAHVSNFRKVVSITPNFEQNAGSVSYTREASTGPATFSLFSFALIPARAPNPHGR